MMKTKYTNEISIIVPVYNIEKYLPRCIESILCQTYEALEILLIDDGSTDDSGNISDLYEKRDSRVRVIHKSNGGLSDARNRGIQASTGKYIMFVDGDDWIDRDMVSLLMRVMEKTGSEIVECSYRNVYQNYFLEDSSCTGELFLGSGLDGIEGLLEWKKYRSVAWNKLYRRSLFDKIAFPVGKVHEDEFTTYKIFFEAQKIASVDISKYNYVRVRGGSIMSGFSQKNLDICDALLERREFIEAHKLYEIEEKANNIYCWLLLDNLSKTVEYKVTGEKVDQILIRAMTDYDYYQVHPVSPQYIEWLNNLKENGLEYTSLKWKAEQKQCGNM